MENAKGLCLTILIGNACECKLNSCPMKLHFFAQCKFSHFTWFCQNSFRLSWGLYQTHQNTKSIEECVSDICRDVTKNKMLVNKEDYHSFSSLRLFRVKKRIIFSSLLLGRSGHKSYITVKQNDASCIRKPQLELKQQSIDSSRHTITSIQNKKTITAAACHNQTNFWSQKGSAQYCVPYLILIAEN